MTEENWVNLPEPNPRTLPQDTIIRLCSWCRDPLYWAVTSELVAEDDGGLVRYRGQAGGDGKPAREFVVASGNISRVKLPPGYRFEGSEVVKGETVAIPASLAGAVGLEKYANEAYAQAIQGQWIHAKPSDGLGDNGYVFRQGDYQQRVQVALGTCPECARKGWCPLRTACLLCGATAKSIEAKRAKPACKCGATENVRPIAVEYVTSWGKKQPGGEDICAPCYVARRRAELQAQKLEQTKRDMNRPVKRDPYEWLGFSSADWEE